LLSREFFRGPLRIQSPFNLITISALPVDDSPYPAVISTCPTCHRFSPCENTSVPQVPKIILERSYLQLSCLGSMAVSLFDYSFPITKLNSPFLLEYDSSHESFQSPLFLSDHRFSLVFRGAVHFPTVNFAFGLGWPHVRP